MANFIEAFGWMILNEDSTLSGKIYPDSNGALTRFGLNAANNSNLVPLGFYSELPNGQPKIPNAQALIIAHNAYSSKYWAKVCGDRILSQPVATKLLDCEVNTGDAPKLLQHFLHSINPVIAVDGEFGQQTLSAVNSLDSGKVIIGLVLWWNWYIDQTLKSHPEDKRYEINWRNRARKYPPNSIISQGISV